MFLIDDVSLYKCLSSPPLPPPPSPSPGRSPNPPSPPSGEVLPDYESSCDLVSGLMSVCGGGGAHGGLGELPDYESSCDLVRGLMWWVLGMQG